MTAPGRRRANPAYPKRPDLGMCWASGQVAVFWCFSRFDRKIRCYPHDTYIRFNKKLVSAAVVT
jgi:hypothetical protein